MPGIRRDLACPTASPGLCGPVCSDKGLKDFLWDPPGSQSPGSSAGELPTQHSPASHMHRFQEPDRDPC